MHFVCKACTTTNWPLIVLGLPSLFLVMSVYRHCTTVSSSWSVQTCYAQCQYTPLACAYFKVETAAWLGGGSCVCDQCPGEDEHVQNEVHYLFSCQDHRVCELRNFSPFCLHLFLRTSQQLVSICCNRSTTNLFTISFLNRSLDLSLSKLIDF